MLGSKWKYYHKIKRGGEGLSLFKEKTLMEQMKATQSALRFTSKSAKNSYRNIYQACVNEIVKNTVLKKEHLPQLPEAVEGKDLPSLTSQFDEVIITWTPLKFFLPAKKIREKGKATQRHTEGLIAKLFFKVAAYYSTPDNWNVQRLAIYVRNIKEDASYQDVVSILEPLKTDLNLFIDAYEPFKFGKAALAKGASQETDAFDDAMAVESFESQVRSLYWYDVIYTSIEQFLFRYYLTLITSTHSTQAIRYLTIIFEPAFEKVIENKNLFLGSFEIDRSKKAFRQPFEEYRQKRLSDPRTSKLKTSKGLFESYVFNKTLLENSAISFELTDVPPDESEWAHFIRDRFFHIPNDEVDINYSDLDEQLDENAPDQIPLELREYAYMQTLATLVNCTQMRRKARHKILERFKKRVVSDKEFAEKQISEVRKKGTKTLAKLERKAAKIKRMKQEEAAKVFEKDIAQFREKLDTRCNTIRQNAMRELNAQKERLQSLFKQISKEDSVNAGVTANYLHQLMKNLDVDGDFFAEFLKYTIDNVQNNYSKELENFYENIFEVLNPSTQEKIAIIQALKKSGGEKSINLSLSPEDETNLETMVTSMKMEIEKAMPEIFKSKVIFLSLAFPVEDLLRISVDNNSMKRLLRLKIALPNTGKQSHITSEAAKSLLVLNRVVNPVPKNNLIMAGKEEETDPQRAINSALLNKLLAEIS